MAIQYDIPAEQAEQEFENFCEHQYLVFDTGTMGEEDRAAFLKNKDRILRAFRLGHLVFNDDHEPVYTPHRSKSKHKDPITFQERTGETLLATDRQKKGKDAAKTYAMLGSLTGLPAATFSGLAGEDIKLCEALMALLMD